MSRYTHDRPGNSVPQAANLGDAVLSAVGPEGIKVHKLAVRTVPHSGKPDELVDHFGIGARSIVEAAKRITK